MSIRCKIFGHKLGRWHISGNTPWLQYTGDMLVADTGTRHLLLRSRCARCGDRYTVGHLQLPSYWVIEPTRPVPESRRVTELLEANNAEVERRRTAEKRLHTSREISNYLAKDLIAIAELAMPDTYFATDSRVRRAKDIIGTYKHDS